MNLSKGFYLVEIKTGQVTKHDGPYLAVNEVAQSFNNFKGLNWVQVGCAYFLAEVFTDIQDELKSTKELFALLMERKQIRLKAIPPFTSQGVFHWDETKQTFVKSQ